MNPVKYGLLPSLFALSLTLIAAPTRAELAADPPDALLTAIDGRDVAQITQILHDHPSLASVKLENGNTPLMEAVGRYAVDSVDALLAGGAKIDGRDASGATPLIAAARASETAIGDLLIERGADVNAQDNQGDTALDILVSASFADTDFLSNLLVHGVDLRQRNSRGFTPLRCAVEPLDKDSNDSGFATARILFRRGASYGSPFLDAVAHDDIASLAKQAAANPKLINQSYTGVAPLDQAIFWQNVKATTWLLNHGANVNAKNDRGETPLVHLISETETDGGDHGLIKVLLEHHADPNIPNTDKQTPLSLLSFISGVSQKDMDEVLGNLIAHGANVNAPDLNGSPILLNVAGNGNHDAALFLLQHGASYRNPFLDAIAHGRLSVLSAMLRKNPALARSSKPTGDPPVRTAYTWGQKSVISFLLAHGAQIDAPGLDGETALMKALESSDLEMSAFLISKGASVTKPNRQGELPMDVVIRYSGGSGLGAVKLLLAHGANPRTVSPNTRLNVLGAAAASDNDVEIVKLLLQKGMDVNNSGGKETPLHLAVRGLRYPMAQLLRDHGGKDDANPLIDAITQGDLSRIKAIVQANPKSLITAPGEFTPLHAAMYWGNPKAVSLLLDLGVDPNQKGYGGVPPLMDLATVSIFAPGPENEAIGEILIARGADVNLVAPYPLPGQKTPLNAAVFCDAAPLAALLIQHGARIDIRDMDGMTPTFFAAGHSDTNLITLLLDHGAAINAKDNLGATPLHYMLEMTASTSSDDKERLKLQSTTAFLRKHGAVE